MISSLKLTKKIKTENFFRIGVFTLASAPLVSSIFFLISVIFENNENKNFFKESWNILLIATSLLMVIGLIFLNISPNSPIKIYEWDKNLSIIGLFNWIPFFWFFWKFQNFLKSKNQRRICSILFIAGTFPVLLSGFGQFWFGWEGPLELFNGLIIWYQRPLEGISGLTGLFNNPNYTGAWLSFIIPFTIAAFQEHKKSLLVKILSLFIFILVFVALILTYSRSAWLCCLFSLAFHIANFKFIKNLKVILSIIFTCFAIFFLFKDNFFDLIQNILPERILSEIDQNSYKNLDLTRIDIWSQALKFISERPLFGWGSGYFPLILKKTTGIWKGHPHNLLLEIFFNYGIIVGTLLFSFVIALIVRSFDRIFIKNFSNSFEKAWLISCFVLLLSQLVDQQYLDIRISLSLWILLSGLKNIIEDKKYNRIE